MLYLWNMNAHGGNKIQIGYFKYKDHKLKRFINWVIYGQGSLFLQTGWQIDCLSACLSWPTYHENIGGQLWT